VGAPSTLSVLKFVIQLFFRNWQLV